MVLVGSPSDFGRLIADETEKWGKVIRAADIRAQAARCFLRRQDGHMPLIGTRPHQSSSLR
jgi:hypothetical protein